MTDVEQLFRDIPRFTRYWLTATVALTLLGRFALVPQHLTALDREKVMSELQLWRCVTALFGHPLNFQFVIHCFFILQYSGRLEKDQFGRSPADFLYLLLFSALMCNITGLLFSIRLLMNPLVVSVVYIWCHLNQDVKVNFWLGIRFKAVYLPWVLAGFDFLFAGEIDSFIGILIGHLFYFLKFQYPQELGGAELLSTPAIIKQYVPDVVGGTGGFGVIPPESRSPQPPAPGNRVLGNNWGRGNILGQN